MKEQLSRYAGIENFLSSAGKYAIRETALGLRGGLPVGLVLPYSPITGIRKLMDFSERNMCPPIATTLAAYFGLGIAALQFYGVDILRTKGYISQENLENGLSGVLIFWMVAGFYELGRAMSSSDKRINKIQQNGISRKQDLEERL